MADNIVKFERRKINEWPREVYLADFGDGGGCRPYESIQRPDDTTPRYTRNDVVEGRMQNLHANLKAQIEELEEALVLVQRIGAMEGKSDGWMRAHMSGVAGAVLDGKSVAWYKRLFPRITPDTKEG